MKKLLLLTLVIFLIAVQANAQVGINSDNSAPDNSAMLDVKSTTRGFLPPRMSDAEMRAIFLPANGLIVYNVSLNALYWYNGSSWQKFNDISIVETDPVFAAHPSSSITSGNISNWNLAYGWGNHATAGYLTSFTETDPVFTVHPSSGISAGNISNWNLAYGWGNHATAGYLTSFTETDPVFTVHPSSGISAGNISNWNLAYGWGNHATAGYLTSFTETDPVFTVHPSSGISAGNINNWNLAYGWGNHATAGYLTSFTESDPVFTVHPSSGISAGNISNWNLAYGWGNHATAGYLTSFTETDPVFTIHPSSGISAGNISNWNLAYGWGNHATAGYLTSFTETDPIFTVHPSSGISAGNISNWNTAYAGRIETATGTAPLSLILGINQLTGSITPAGASSDGYLSSSDWNIFNSKVSSQWNSSGADIYFNSGNVGIGTATPDNSAILDVASNSKGMLVPRMTTVQRDAISSPANGLIIFCTTDDRFYYNQGNPGSPDWVILGSEWVRNGTSIYYPGGNVGIGEPDPLYPLNFSSTIGDKISLYGTTANHYGFGIQGNQLQIHGDGSASDILFGYGSSAAFTEQMRIKGTGQVGIGTSAPNASASLEISSTTRGFLPPRMTAAQRNGIPSPVAGLIIFNTDENAINVFNGTGWKQMIPTDACPPVLLDTRNGKLYTTVQIGTQCWMAQNLNVGTRINGIEEQKNNGIIEKYCYDDLESNCDIYGGLYQWDEAMQYVTTAGVQGICPIGWHLPTDAEWTSLTTFLGGMSVAGGKMKEVGTAHWFSPNTGASNSSGFTALPGGYRDGSGSFNSLTYNAYFWSSSQYDASSAWERYLHYSNASVYRSNASKTYGFSGRCLKD